MHKFKTRCEEEYTVAYHRAGEWWKQCLFTEIKQAEETEYGNHTQFCWMSSIR